jgi:hypothetical protein
MESGNDRSPIVDGCRAATRQVLHVITQQDSMHCSKLMCEKEFFATFVVFYAGEFNFN